MDIQVDAINIAAENRVFVTEHSSMVQDNLTAEIANRLAAYRSYRENPYRLTDEQIANIRLGSELILSAIDENNKKHCNKPKFLNPKTIKERRGLFSFNIHFKVPLSSEGVSK